MTSNVTKLPLSERQEALRQEAKARKSMARARRVSWLMLGLGIALSAGWAVLCAIYVQTTLGWT